MGRGGVLLTARQSSRLNSRFWSVTLSCLPRPLHAQGHQDSGTLAWDVLSEFTSGANGAGRLNSAGLAGGCFMGPVPSAVNIPQESNLAVWPVVLLKHWLVVVHGPVRDEHDGLVAQAPLLGLLELHSGRQVPGSQAMGCTHSPAPPPHPFPLPSFIRVRGIPASGPRRLQSGLGSRPPCL